MQFHRGLTRVTAPAYGASCAKSSALPRPSGSPRVMRRAALVAKLRRFLIHKLLDVAVRMERALNDLIATLPEYRERATLPAKGRTRAEERRLRDLGYFH
ncbi:MAG: hypothetical protein HUU22_02470 [Phycisphaerae bacterium]|nr:hypothetical protein [Phycisphaerae bacterium]